MNPKEKCLLIVTIWIKQPIWGGQVCTEILQKNPSKIIVQCLSKLGKRCHKLNSLMVNIKQERNITSIYSFSRHEKQLRKLTTCSRLGPIDSSAKTFTVRSFAVRLVRIIFRMTDEQTSSELEIMLICRRRGRRRPLYLNGCGSNNKFRVFVRRVAHHCQFRHRNDIDSCWSILINYK